MNSLYESITVIMEWCSTAWGVLHAGDRGTALMFSLKDEEVNSDEKKELLYSAAKRRGSICFLEPYVPKPRLRRADVLHGLGNMFHDGGLR